MYKFSKNLEQKKGLKEMFLEREVQQSSNMKGKKKQKDDND